MGYNIVPTQTNKTSTRVLGISYASSNNQSQFTPIYTTNDQALENLKTLLLTRVGERYSQPEFGTFLLNVIFEPINDDIKRKIEDLILPPISKFLPYITIDQIEIITKEDDPTLDHSVTVKITFSADPYEINTLTLSATENGTLVVE